MPPRLPDTRQILAGIWIRLMVLAPILMAPITCLWLFGVLPSSSSRTVGALLVLLVLALDTVRNPSGIRQGART
jgi:hypothetical protein